MYEAALPEAKTPNENSLDSYLGSDIHYFPSYKKQGWAKTAG